MSRALVPWRRRRKTSSPESSTSTSGTSSAILRELLTALRESTDAFPPLKSAVSAALHICTVVEQVKSNKEEAEDIAMRTVQVIELVYHNYDLQDISEDLALALEGFTSDLRNIAAIVEKHRTQKRLSRFIHKNKHAAELQRCKVQLDEARKNFQLASSVRVERQMFTLDDRMSKSTHQMDSDREDILLALTVLDRTIQTHSILLVF